MTNKQKAILFAALAAVMAASSAPLIANKSINHVVIVFPLGAMVILLVLAGYYARKRP